MRLIQTIVIVSEFIFHSFSASRVCLCAPFLVQIYECSSLFVFSLALFVLLHIHYIYFIFIAAAHYDPIVYNNEYSSLELFSFCKRYFSHFHVLFPHLFHFRSVCIFGAQAARCSLYISC